MRLDPVFLVEPKPAAASIPTRRAFLVAGGTFAFGLSIGGACGYAMGAASANGAGGGTGSEQEKEAPAAQSEELKPSGDVDLDELRRLAVKAPIEELLEYRIPFLREFSLRYRNDEMLWRGVGRIADAVIARPDYPNRLIAATAIAQVIEFGEPGLQRLLGAKVRILRSLR
jgi:hypothetical protein